MHRPLFCLALPAVLTFAFINTSSAANKHWKNSVGSGNWSTGSNWSNVSAAGADNGGSPGINDTVFIAPTDGAARTIAYDASLAFLSGFSLDGPGVGRTTLSMSSGELNAAGFLIGDSGRATVNQSGGAFRQTDAALDGAIGWNGGSSGIYNLSGTGTFSLAKDLYVGAAQLSSGVVNQTGGTATIGRNLLLGSDVLSNGSYSISAGTLTVNTNAGVGNLGTGTMTIQNQGSVWIGNNLAINSLSSVNLSGGTLRLNTVTGVNRLNYTAGTVQLSGNRRIQTGGGTDTVISQLFGADPTIPLGKTLRIEGVPLSFDAATTIQRHFQVNGGTLKSDGEILLTNGPGSGCCGDDYGRLTIANGGTVEGRYLSIGGNESSSAFGVAGATVSGVGSSLQLDTTLFVGYSSAGVLEVLDGGQVTSVFGSIGPGYVKFVSGGDIRFATHGTALVSGAGSSWTTQGLQVGSPWESTDVSAVLTIDDGASVYVEDELYLLPNATVNLNGGTLRFNRYSRDVPGSETFNFVSGTIVLAGNRVLGLDTAASELFGGVPTMSPGKNLTVEGTASFLSAAIVDGGVLTVGALSDASNLERRRGRLNVTNQQLSINAMGPFGSSLELPSNFVLNSTLGVLNQGLVTGDGEIGGLFTNAAAGELRGEPGKSLTLTGANNVNAGRINLYGGQVEFTQNLTNNAGGTISGNGTLISRGGLTNAGTMNFSGLANVVGDVVNSPGGTIISSGGGPTTYYDDVVNQGEIRTSAGGFTVFFGAASGSGAFTGPGTVNFEGDLSPGSSAGRMDFAGDVALGLDAAVNIELGGATPGTQYDQIRAAGELALAGEMSVSLIGGFTPTAGQAFNILDWGSLHGEFDSIFLPLVPGLAWDASQLYSTGVLSLVAATSSDFNGDGAVNSDDLAEWKGDFGVNGDSDADGDGDSDGADFLAWQRRLGQNAAVVTTTAAVPEPACSMLLFVAALCLAKRWRRRSIEVRLTVS